MPLHDYRCSACGAQFERLVRAGETPTCPACAGSALERLVSAVAPAGRSRAIVASARRAAAREGHFSNYSRAERAKVC